MSNRRLRGTRPATGVVAPPSGYLLPMAIKQKLARKAVRSTAKHTAHGAASKLKRDPLRTSTLLLAGAVVGLLAGWFAGRGNSGAVLQSAPSPS
jgi:hypothetical protein